MILPIEQLDPAQYAALWSDFRGLTWLNGSWQMLNQGTVRFPAGSINPTYLLAFGAMANAPGPKGLVFDGTHLLAFTVGAPQLCFGAHEPFSICVHLRNTGVGGNAPLVSCGLGVAGMVYELSVIAGVLTFRLYQSGNSAIYTSRQVASVNWGLLGNGHDLFVTATYGGGGIKIYYEGDRVDDTTVNAGLFTGMNTTANLFSVGSSSTLAPSMFVGTMYDLRVYPFELSQGQAAYLATRARQERWV